MSYQFDISGFIYIWIDIHLVQNTCVKKPSFRRVRFPDEVVFDDSIREADGDFFILQYFLKYSISQEL